MLLYIDDVSGIYEISLKFVYWDWYFLVSYKKLCCFKILYVILRYVLCDDILMYILIKLYGKLIWIFGYICSFFIIYGVDNLFFLLFEI